MRKQRIIYIDGKYIEADIKTIEAFTPGVFQARGVFETMLAIGGKVFDVETHLKRLRSTFKSAGCSSGVVHRVVKANGFNVTRVRVVAWQEGGQKHIAVMALKYTLSKKKIFKVCLIKTNRSARSCSANTKSLDYRLFASAYQKAKVKGLDEALLINRQGHIFEASRSNVFIIHRGRIITPPLSSGCLNGITRQKVMGIVRKLGLPVLEKNLTVSMVRTAPKAFLTNSLLGVQPFQF